MPAVPSLYPTQSLSGGRYQVLGLLRVGGAASAWRAVVRTTGEIVAIKAMDASEGGAERAVREAEVTRGLAHPGVVPVREVFVEGGIACMVMPLARCSLADHVAALGPLSPPQAAGALLGPLGALTEAHGHGVVHRDVKPHNLLLFEDGGVRLADWGAARSRLDGNGSTRTGALLGTVPFMAPEQRRDPRAAGAAADVYAIGVTLAWLCLGKPPEDPAIPETHARLRAGLPEGLTSLVIAACAFAPESRPSARVLREKVEAWLAETRDPGSPLVLPAEDMLVDDVATAVGRLRVDGGAAARHASRPARVWLAGGMGLASVGFAAWALTRAPTAETTRPLTAEAPPSTPRRLSAEGSDGEALAALGSLPRCADYVSTWIDTIHPAPRETVGAYVRDLDGDGTVDVVYTNQQDENATVWWGARGALPQTSTVLPIGRSSRAVGTGDVDADGRTDLVVYRPDEGMFDLWRGLGDRRFAKADTSTHTEILDASPIDWDGDGDLDLVIDIRALAFVGLRERVAAGWKPHRWVATGRVGGVVRVAGKPHVYIRKDDHAVTLGRPAEPRAVETELFAADDPLGRARLVGTLDLDGDGTDTLFLALAPCVIRYDLAARSACRLTDVALNQLRVADLDGDDRVELVEWRTCATCTSNHVFRIAE